MRTNKDYTRLLNSKRWRDLRAWKLSQNPVCEMCNQAAAVNVHHVRPIDTASTLKEMEALCFSPGNLMALCYPCHVRTHNEQGKDLKKNIKERKRVALERWIAKHNRADDPAAPGSTGTEGGKC